MEPVTIFTAVMITRLFAPVIKGGWRYITNAEEKEKAERYAGIVDDYNRKIEYQRIGHEQRLEEAKASHALAMQQWAQKTYYERCWPLRNPFEMQICEPISNDTEYLGKLIVPCRLISALKDSDHPYARTINGNLSSFVVNFFPTNGTHAVVSEIGAWKEDAPSNDASINYLYAGLKKQPVFVIHPTLINDGKTIIFKAWSWGLGEELNYPAGFEFGRIELRPLFLKNIYRESLAMWKLSKELGSDTKRFSPALQHNLSIIKDIQEKKLSDAARDKLLTFLKDTPEISEYIKQKMESELSGVFCCIAGMYADAYHLFEYNTAPKLPQLLHQIPGVEYMLPSLKAYYYDMLTKMEELNCDREMIAKTYMEVAESFSKLNFSFPIREAIIVPFATKALGLYVSSQDSEENPDDLNNLTILRHIIKSEPKYQSSDLVKRINEVFKRVKMQLLW